MIANVQSGTQADAALSGLQKAAVLLVVVGDQVGAELIRHLTEDEIQIVSREVAKMKQVTPNQAEGVLEEFYQLAAARDFIAKGGVDYARNMLMTAFGPETAKRLMDRLMKALGDGMTTFDALQKADPQQLAKFLHSEHPQTVALVLSHLNPSQAAALLASLPAHLRGDVALRVASLDQISPEVISRIASVIGQRMNAIGEFSRESYGGVRAVAEMFNRLDSETAKEILTSIESQDNNLVETIRHLMFVFEDILLIDVNGLKEVVNRADRKVIALALKGTGDQIRNHFFQCMSQRGAQTMLEDIEALGPVRIREVEAAQQQIIGVIRGLESEGVLSVRGAVGEQYVV
ncbi:MAG TPA: flagellar motor switch protein FliG [Bryobacteraceae bacterium]|nr:flagellar motor switch protein FliG [Bryobacteraceae bacterium]